MYMECLLEHIMNLSKNVIVAVKEDEKIVSKASLTWALLIYLYQYLYCLDKLSGLQGVNEDPKQAEERAAFWSTIKHAHFEVKIATKNLLALFGFIAIGSSLEQLGRFSKVDFADIPFSF
uniref:Probable mitochondrial saccharopine dehydrogenase-like oxidoreductase At5g39410 n=1 Tax=Tanacetum cinerariifolium TaxID=118510 RepID=A0A6L2JUD1_TANCI|nr:probable mitochondrial saccharopine dehydrogenase-like oxidoreductase At5g39410 [Tanacetum cinerariifolium]